MCGAVVRALSPAFINNTFFTVMSIIPGVLVHLTVPTCSQYCGLCKVDHMVKSDNPRLPKKRAWVCHVHPSYARMITSHTPQCCNKEVCLRKGNVDIVDAKTAPRLSKAR